MNKKQIVATAIIGSIFMSFPSPMLEQSAIADEQDYIQTLNIPHGNPDSVLLAPIAFPRGTYKIIETKPWLKKENQIKRLSESQLIRILSLAGFKGSGLEMAKSIVFLESTNRPYAFNRSSNCYGLFQINMTGSLGPNRRAKYGLSQNEDLFNPVINASIAFKMSNGGKNWSAWSTEKAAKKITN